MRDPRRAGAPRVPDRRARLLRRSQRAPRGRWPTTLPAEAAGRLPSRRRVLGRLAAWAGSRIAPGCRPDSDNLQLLRSRADEASEQVLLDENVVAPGPDTSTSGSASRAPDGALLAWSADIERSGDLRAPDQGPADRRGPAGGDRTAASRASPGPPLRDYLFYLVPDELLPAVPGLAPSRSGRRRRGRARVRGARSAFRPDAAADRGAASWR